MEKGTFKKFFWEMLVDLFSQSFLKAKGGRQGESKFLKIRALAVQLHLVKGLRSFFKLVLMVFTFYSLWIVGVLLVIGRTAFFLPPGAEMRGDPYILTGLILLIFPVLGLLFVFREKFWLDIFGIQEKIDEIAGISGHSQKEDLERENKNLVPLIESIVEEKARKVWKELAAAGGPPHLEGGLPNERTIGGTKYQ